MTTTTRRGPSVQQQPEPLSLFGRPWQGHEVLVPLLAWFVTAAASFGLYLAHLDHGASFWWWTAGSAVGFALVGLALGHGAGHGVGMVKAWCLLTPLTAGGWVMLSAAVGARTGWLYLVWLGLMVASVVLYINARHTQYNHETDHFNGVNERQRLEEERLRRRLTVPAQRDPEPFPTLTAKQREALKFEMLLAKAGAGPGPDRGTLVRAGLAKPPTSAEVQQRGSGYVDPDSRLTVFERIPTDAGFTLWVKLPDDASVSFEAVRQIAGKLEQLFGAKLLDDFPEGSRPGCVRVQRGKSKTGEAITTEVYIHVDVRDVLAKVLRMPERRGDYEPISVYDGFPVGEFADGTPIHLTLAEIHVMMVGRTRMGKSNLLNLLTRQLARCYDVVMWAYDGKGGRWLRPWLQPWLDGVIDPHTNEPLARPVFDWCAIDLVEFERMIDGGIELAKERPGLPYATGSGWSATKENPWVIILADELSEAAGSNGASSQYADTRVSVTTAGMQEKLARLTRLGAGEGVSMVVAQQRGTVTSGMSGDGKSQIGGRIVLPVKAGEVSDVLADADFETVRLATSLRWPGSTVIEGFGYDDAMPGKWWLFGQKAEVEAVAKRQVVEVTHIRPGLDWGSAAALVKFGYATRWTDPDRTAWMHRRKPTNPVYRWSAELDNARATAAGKPQPGAPTDPNQQPRSGTRAAEYGLEGIPDPFAAHREGAPTEPSTPEAYEPAGHLGDGDTASAWAAAGPEFAAEMGWRFDKVQAEHDGTDVPPAPPTVQAEALAAGAPPEGSDRAQMYGPPLRTVEPTYTNLWPIMIEIVAASQHQGCTASEVIDALRARNLAPRSRGTVNNWLDQLDGDHRLVRTGSGRSVRYYAPGFAPAAAA